MGSALSAGGGDAARPDSNAFVGVRGSVAEALCRDMWLSSEVSSAEVEAAAKKRDDDEEEYETYEKLQKVLEFRESRRETAPA